MTQDHLRIVQAALSVCLTSALAKAEEPPVIGAIRWDGWFKSSPWQQVLRPPQWHNRLPFYTRIGAAGELQVCSESQPVMDREIVLAGAAGLSYWAFDYYHPDSWRDADRLNYGLRLYQRSPYKAKLNFCLIIFPMGRHLGPPAQWPATAETFVRLFKDPSYQKVLGDRPLLYVYHVEHMADYFGSEKAARNALKTLRRKTVAAGLGPTYVVAQVFQAAAGRDSVDRFGFDAISAYTIFDFQGATRQYPFRALAKANRDFWDACRDTKKKIIPIINFGWDNRPLRGHKKIYAVKSPGGPWYTQPTPREIEDHLRAACQWIQANPRAAEANAGLIYAWNETAEGGWLHPTLSEGTARLDAIRKILRSGKAGDGAERNK